MPGTPCWRSRRASFWPNGFDRTEGSRKTDSIGAQSVRAKLRLMVKTILKKWKYPPDGQEQATETVLEQAKELSEAWALTG
ncbi:MAG: type I restriction enzyme endonuclease domain-containing protein [Acidobacteriaceae bacterium]